MARAAKLKTPESAVLKGCLQTLKAFGVLAWRNNTGSFRVEGRYVRAGLKGSADILGVIPFVGPCEGKFIAVECKGTGGKTTPEQDAFLAAVNAAGGIGVVVRDVAELADLLGRLKRGV